MKAASANAPRFEIKKWNAVAMWSWDICADTVSQFPLRGENIDLRSVELTYLPPPVSCFVSPFLWQYSSVPSAETHSMSHRLSTKQIRPRPMTTGYLSPSVIVVTFFISIVFSVGWRLEVYVLCATRNGTSLRSNAFPVTVNSEFEKFLFVKVVENHGTNGK